MMADQPRPLGMEAASGAYATTLAKLELWTYGTYAHAWFADAQKEISLVDEHARRREIIFAVCAVESYLVEWVRDDVLNKSFRRLAHYFPLKDRNIGIDKRLRRVIEGLYTDGTITKKPTLAGQYWDAFTSLVKFRNGIVHGRTSRPDSEGVAEPERPEPTVEQLTQRGPGWAVKVAADVIKKLHEAVGTPPPAWIGT